MSVFRVAKNGNYTVMANYHLRDEKLSLQAKGLMSYMLSLPEDWDYTMAGLSSKNKIGVKGIRTILQELEGLGYLERERHRGNNGHFEYEYNIFEKPKESNEDESLPDTPPRHTPPRHTLSRYTVKDTLLNTNILSTKELNTNPLNKEKESIKEKEKTSQKFKVPSIEELVAFKKEAGLDSVDVEYFFNYYESNGWKVGNHSMKNWKAAMRNWHTRNLKDRPQGAAGRAIVQADADSAPYVPEPTEDIREWRDFFDEWENIIGMRPAQTVGNVKAALLLKRELSREMNQALMVALAMRSKTGYITKEIKEISSPRDLYRSKEKVWAFYQEHREQWQWQMNMRRSAGLD